MDEIGEKNYIEEEKNIYIYEIQFLPKGLYWFTVHSGHPKWKSQIVPSGTNEMTQSSQKDIPLPAEASQVWGETLKRTK